MKKIRYIIAPSILSADFLHLGSEIAACENAGADWIHVDVMDGHFVPNLTMGPFIVKHVRRGTSLPVDVHLMVQNPENLLESFAKAGADHLTVHVETCPDIVGTLKKIKALGCKAGVTLNPDTSASELTPALPHADLVLVMTVHPGYSGQSFMPEVLPKIAEVRQMLDALGSAADLEVDGGISAATLPKVLEAGANAFVAANAIFMHPDGITDGIQALRKILTFQ
jgi:ribulose-phosphate 3-epimerase